MLLTILLVVLCLICVMLIGVVLMQRSEGGALGMGGSSGSLISARGAGDLLTRITWILGGSFFFLSLAISVLSGMRNSSDSVTERLDMGAVNSSPLNIAPASGQPAQSGQPAAQPGAPPLPDAGAPPLPDAAPAPAAAAPTSAPLPTQ